MKRLLALAAVAAFALAFALGGPAISVASENPELFGISQTPPGVVESDVSRLLIAQTGDPDSDGDGIADAEDSCPHTPDSGLDSDGDGIDDACDSD